MDFFDAQDRAKRFTWKLVTVYSIAVSAIIVIVFTVTSIMFRVSGLFPEVDGVMDQLQQKEFFVSVLFLLSLIFGSTYLRITKLKRGGYVVAELLNGVKVTPSTTNQKEKQLIHIVEEMAIASGLPVPDVYILKEEEGINAFAAGQSVGDAVIGITKGALKKFKRDELQAVIAHEFSHIFHGDILLNIRLIGFLTGINRIHQIGKTFVSIGMYFYRSLLRFFYRSDETDLMHFFIKLKMIFLLVFLISFPVYWTGILFFTIVGALFLIIGHVGFFIGRILQSSISRQREFLADASAVQYTRNPNGLVRALKKIVNNDSAGKMKASEASDMNHLFFVSACSSYLDRLISSHPPTEERIYALAPITARYSMQLEKERQVKQIIEKPVKPKAEEWSTSDVLGQQSQFPVLSNMINSIDAISPKVILAIIGILDTPHREAANQLLETIPETLREDARNPVSAEALILALLIINQDGDVPECVKEMGGGYLESEVKRILEQLKQVKREVHLPLAELSMPALKEMSPAQFRSFKTMMRSVINSYTGMNLFAISLMMVILSPLKKKFMTRHDSEELYLLKDLGIEVTLLLSAIAYESKCDPVLAWEAGYNKVKTYYKKTYTIIKQEDLASDDLEKAIEKLRNTDTFSEKVIVEAVVEAILKDHNLSIAQLEMLRAILESLGCPVPVLLTTDTDPVKAV